MGLLRAGTSRAPAGESALDEPVPECTPSVPYQV